MAEIFRSRRARICSPREQKQAKSRRPAIVAMARKSTAPATMVAFVVSALTVGAALAQNADSLERETYPFEILQRNTASSWQVPIEIATLTIRQNRSMLLKYMDLRLVVRAAALETRDGRVVVPIELTRPDELEIVLISPDGQAIAVGKARRFRDEQNSFGSRLPVSAVVHGRILNPAPSGAALFQVQPRISDIGLPETDADGILQLDEMRCERPVWFGVAAGAPRIGLCDRPSMSNFERARSQQPPEVRSDFISVQNPNPPGAHYRLEASLPAVHGITSYGTWTLAIADSRPLQHDLLDPRRVPLNEVDVLDIENINRPLVPRMTLVSAEATFHGWYEPPGSMVYRRFNNELNLDRPNGQELIGATTLLASGVEMHEVGIDLRLKPVASPAEGRLQISLEAPDRRRFKVGDLPASGGHINLPTSRGLKLQDWQRGRPIDGTWRLHVEVLDADGKLQNRADRYFIAWSLITRGESTDWTGHIFETDLVSQSNGWREARFNVNLEDTVRDAQVDLSGVDGLNVRHDLELFAPNGRRIAASCRRQDDPVADRCLKVDLYGQGYRIALPSGIAARGTWRVRWRPVADPGAIDYQTDGAVSEQQSCQVGDGAVAVSPLRLVTALDQTVAAGMAPTTITLGLSRSRLDQAMLAHRVVDDGELRPRIVTLFNEDGADIRATVHRIARDRYHRAFWSTWDTLVASGTGTNSGIRRVIDQYRATGAEDLARHLGTVDALRAHIHNSGRRSLLTYDLYAELSRPANFDVVNAMAHFGPSIAGSGVIQERRSWLMNGYDPRDEGQVVRRFFGNVVDRVLENAVFHPVDAYAPIVDRWINGARDPSNTPLDVAEGIVRDIAGEVGSTAAETSIKMLLKMGAEEGLPPLLEAAWEATETVGDSLVETVATGHYQNEADKDLHKFESAVEYMCGDTSECRRQYRPNEGLVAEACGAGSTSPYCDMEEYQQYRPQQSEQDDGGEGDGGEDDSGEQGGSGDASGDGTETGSDQSADGESVGSPSCTEADDDCDEPGNTYCGAQQDSCGADHAAVLVYQLERARRLAWDKLYAQWGDLAPYVNCAGDFECGTTPGQPNWVSNVGPLDPLIYCASGTSGVCAPNQKLAVCRSFEVLRGDIDPQRP